MYDTLHANIFGKHTEKKKEKKNHDDTNPYVLQMDRKFSQLNTPPPLL